MEAIKKRMVGTLALISVLIFMPSITKALACCDVTNGFLLLITLFLFVIMAMLADIWNWRD